MVFAYSESGSDSTFLIPLRIRQRLAQLLYCLAVCAIAFGGALVSSLAGETDSAAAATSGFRPDSVEEAARNLAAAPYDAKRSQVPQFLLSLTGEQWRSLRYLPNRTLWQTDGLPFGIRFFHPGFIYDRQVAVNIVDGEKCEKVNFSADMFEIKDAALAEQIRKANLDFAGFSLCFAGGEPGNSGTDEGIATFLGASYFQSAGRNSRFGVYARGLALDTANPDGEVFPYFREYWLVKPKRDDQTFTLYALMDSSLMTGAFRFEIVPGTSTIMNVDGKLFRRGDANANAKIGIAPLTSMFLYSETQNGKPNEYRPEVHDSDGLQYKTGDEAWFWRPLANPSHLRVTNIPMDNPTGFGLMQRDDVFDHYQDLTSRFDRRSSLWVEPQGNWGPGHLELVEIPGTEDYNDNMIAYWVPEQPDKPTAENAQPQPAKDPDAPLSHSYRLYWMTPGAPVHALGRAADTRMVKAPGNDAVTFTVDFSGENLNALDADVGLTSVVTAPDQAPLLEKSLVKNPVTGGWRLTAKFRLPQKGMVESLLTVRDGPPHLRFSAFLKKGENIPEPLTETWVYELIP